MDRLKLEETLKSYDKDFDAKNFAEKEWEDYICPGSVGAGVYYGLNLAIMVEEIVELLSEVHDVENGGTNKIGLEEELADNWLGYHFIMAASHISESIIMRNDDLFTNSPETVLMTLHQVVCKVLRGRRTMNDIVVLMPCFRAALKEIEKKYEIDHSRISKIMQLKFDLCRASR